jgi:hypothetical protein
MSMTDTYRISIIARGRVIEPVEDAVEYKGRGGATFLTSDPHKHIHDLVLGNPVLLGDFQQTPIRDIIDFLAEAGKRLKIEDNVFLQESFVLALHAGGLAEPILRGVYDDLPHMFDPVSMFAQIDSTVGADYLDGWVASPAGPHCRVRAVGTRQLHITAGNVPVVAALTIVRGALTKSDILIKSPSNDLLSANPIMRDRLLDPFALAGVRAAACAPPGRRSTQDIQGHPLAAAGGPARRYRAAAPQCMIDQRPVEEAEPLSIAAK